MTPAGEHGTTRAFTLAEMLVVLVVLCIAAALAVPMVTGSGDSQAVAACRILASDIQYAQNVAVTSQKAVTVIFEPTQHRYRLVDNQSAPLIHPMTKTAYVMDFASQRGFDRLRMVSADFGGQSLTFDELGDASAGGSVIFQAGPHVYRLDVSASTGRVTVAAQ